MPTPRPADVTELLADVVRGEAGAADRLLPAVYDELRELARRLFRRQPWTAVSQLDLRGNRAGRPQYSD